MTNADTETVVLKKSCNPHWTQWNGIAGDEGLRSPQRGQNAMVSKGCIGWIL
jgi:hypothetical protein